MHSALDHIPEARDIPAKVRAYIVDNVLLGQDGGLDNHASLLEAGILDSTGAMEIVAFLEAEFGIQVADHEITADNLDSIERISALVTSKQG